MENICIVTGGGSGIGFEAARILGKNHKVILVGRTVSKLDGAIDKLKAQGIDAQSFPADISDRESVKKLAAYAAEQGNVKTVIHAAGISPNMADGEKILEINAMGTINVNEELAEVMKAGSCILNVSSMAAYMLPEAHSPKQIYRLSLKDTGAFLNGLTQVLASIPEESKRGSAYTISKNFVVWFTEKMALKYGKKGIRVVSIAPGTIRTPMGELEGEAASSIALNGALGRLGEPEEIARMMAFIVSDECSYLTGVDILYDGGSIAAVKAMQEENQQ